MATFSIYGTSNARLRGARFTKKADGIVLMGALVQKGTAAGDVKETDASTNNLYGIAVVNEAAASANADSDGNAQYWYPDNDPLVVEALVTGQVYNLLNSGTAAISEGALVEMDADGKVVAGTTDPIGIAINGISGSSRGDVLFQPFRNDA